MTPTGRPAPRLPLLLLSIVLVMGARDLRAQQPAPPATEPPSVAVDPLPSGPEAEAPDVAAPGAGGGEVVLSREGMLELVLQANPLLWPLVICSVVTLGFGLERLIALRRNRVIPRDFVERFLDRLSSGKLDRERAVELCRANDSTVARIFARIVHYWGHPPGVIREVVAAEAAGEILDLRRNVRVLNGAATLAPLLGLLGTVFGMIEAFDALGHHTAAGMGKSEALAHGISLALIATAFGLAIAAVAVVFYYYLLNRVDVLVRALDREATRVIDLVSGDPSALGRPPADYRRGVIGPGDLARHDARGL